MKEKGKVRGKDEMKMPSARPDVSACHAALVPASRLQALFRPCRCPISEPVTYRQPSPNELTSQPSFLVDQHLKCVTFHVDTQH